MKSGAHCMDSCRHITESFRGLVVDLSDQVVNSSMQSAISEPQMQEKDSDLPSPMLENEIL